MTTALVRLWPWLLAALVLAPMAAPGYVLTYDMVFVPDQALRADYWGLGQAVPRAVPSDAVISLASIVLPGQILQKLILVGILVMAGTGVRKVLARASVPAQLAAMTWYVWNPFVAERLLLGQWAILVGYAALPWVLALTSLARTGSTKAAGAAILAVAAAAITASGGVLAAGLGCAILLAPGAALSRRTRWLAAAAMVAVNAPWIVSGLFHAERAVSGLAAVEAFAARAEGHLPMLLTLLGLGGVWNSDVVPDSRVGWGPVLWLPILVTLMILGARQVVTVLGKTVTFCLTAVAGVCFLVAAAGALVPELVADITTAVPGMALFRDGPRYLAPVALVEAIALGLGIAWCVQRLRSPLAAGFVIVGACLAPLVVMPDLAWGALGRLQPVDYPNTWNAAREAVIRDGGPGDALFLPLAPYRAFSWNESRPGLDPAPRFFPTDALASDALRVDGVLVQAEEPRAALAERRFMAADREGLREMGVGYVIATAELPGIEALADRADLTPIYVSDDIAVYSVPSPEPRPTGSLRVIATLGGWAILLLAVLLGAWLAAGHPLGGRGRALDTG